MMDRPLLLGFPDYATQTEALAQAAGLEHAMIERHRFPDGESCIRLPTELPQRIILCRSLDHPNDKLVELELVTASAREAGVEHVTLVAPYLCYMRQDIAFRPGEAVSQRIIGRWLTRQIDALITVDAHLHRVHDLADAVPASTAVNLSAAHRLGEFIATQLDRPLLVGPDEESQQWLQRAAAAAGTDSCVASKKRRGDREVSIALPEADFAGRDIVLIDDVASTGQTLIEAAQRLKARGAGRIDAALTHALFVDGACERLQQTGIRHVWSTDSIPHPSNRVSLAPLITEALRQQELL